MISNEISRNLPEQQYTGELGIKNNDRKIEETPRGVMMLAYRLLDPKNEERIADFGTGRGGFISLCHEFGCQASFDGYETDEALAEDAERLTGADNPENHVRILRENFLAPERGELEYQVAFANLPIGTGFHNSKGKPVERELDKKELVRTYGNLLSCGREFSGKAMTTMDWIYSAAVVSRLAEKGRAVCIMSLGSAVNTLDRVARMNFLGQRRIRTVITLPDKVFDFTSLPTVMIVFGEESDGVMMVDASKNCTPGRRRNVITESDISAILENCQKEGTYSRLVSFSELAENDYVLNPERYLKEKKEIRNGRPLGEILMQEGQIRRGVQFSAGELSYLQSETPTNYRYLVLGNIQNGKICYDGMDYLKDEGYERFERYVAEPGDLLISKIGNPFKIVLVEESEDNSGIISGAPARLVVSGNLYLIRLNRNICRPRYLKAFLESEAGQEQLSSITVGAVIPIIGVKQLEEMQVPVLPMETQERIEEEYIRKLGEIREMKRKLSDMEEEFKKYMSEQFS